MRTHGCGQQPDDDANFRQVLRGLLTGMADHLVEAENGNQALAILGLLRKDELTRERLEFTIRGIIRGAP